MKRCLLPIFLLPVSRSILKNFVMKIRTANKRSGREGAREGGRAGRRAARSVIKNIDDCMTYIIFPDLYLRFYFKCVSHRLIKTKQNKVKNRNNKNKKGKEMEK